MRKASSWGVTAAVLMSLLLPVVAAAPASATAPDHVSISLDGCKPGTFDPVTITCADGDYTKGNLGKSWNELDLVPYRLTTETGNSSPATQTYTFAVVLDNQDAGHPGYDVISTFTKKSGPCTFSVGSQSVTTGFGGIDQSIYRLVTITQAKNTTCVWDLFGRLALGSHLFPGSSLHANLANENLGTQGIGASDVSIPVKEISPQELRKTMTAQQQDANVTWDITKEATPAELHFGNTCDPNSPTSLTTNITITWTKNPATGGDVLVTTHVFAKNPAHRTITVDVTDVIKSGTTALDTASTPAGGVDVPANTELEVLTHSTTITAAQAVDLNDTATATYTDKQTGIPVPGNTTANASATVQPGNITNNSASIQDIESISGTGLQFSVATPSVGAFDGYTAGDKTTGPVTWNSGTVTASGSVTFNKTVYFSGPGDVTGSLDDTATLTTSGNVTSQASASVEIDASTQATLTINKTTDVPVDGDTDFVFKVTGPGGFDSDVTVTILDGQTSGSNTLAGLEDGNYNVSETNSGLFTPAADQQFTIDAGECAEALTFNNTITRARASATKVTVPAGGQEGWTLKLFKDNAPAGPGNEDTLIATDVTDANGLAEFGEIADEGNYYITEEGKDGFISDGGVNCTFTVNYPADTGAVFDDCQFTNTEKADADVTKLTVPAGSEAGWEFTLFKDEAPAGAGAEDTEIATVVSVDDQPLNFGVKLDAGSYYVLETDGPTGFESDGGNAGCVFSVAYPADAGQTFHCTFTNRAQGNIIVRKVTNPAGSNQSFEFDTSYDASNFFLKDNESDDSGPLPSATYSVAEVNVPNGWDLTNTTCVSSKGDSETAGSISLQTGETVTCTFTNTQRGRILVDKVTNPAGSAQSFEFDPSYGANFFLKDADAPNDSGLLVPGTYSVAEVNIPAGWDLTGSSCDDGSAVNAISLQPGETVTCTFNDRQRATIKVSKTLTNGPSDTQFTFELRELSNDNDPLNPTDDTIGALLDTKVIAANNTPVQLNGFLLPGTYTICEVLPGPGWTSDLGGIDQYTLTIALDNSRVCADFTLGAGDAKVVAVANTRPGGAQLTIGFWKNHASCKKSNGGQAAVLDATLALAGNTLIGDLNLTGSAADCVKAVNVLNKTTIDGRTKKSSDPLFNMAAQLLAAKLNVTGGAGTCTASTNAINAAQQLLVKYHWNGLTYSPALTAADAALANQLNNTLDLYNNGNLC